MQLTDSSYLLLATLRKNGHWVNTPVWFAYEGNQLYIFSAGNAGKVKRLRNFSAVQVSPCTVLGRPLGDIQQGDGQLLQSDSDIKKAHQALLKRFGWQMRITDVLSKLSGKFYKRQYIKVTLQG